MKNTKYDRDYFQKDLEKRLKDPEFREAYEQEGLRLEIALQVHRIREQNRLSQKKLAQKLHMPQQKVSLIEQGAQNMTIDTLYKLAKGLGKAVSIKFI